MVQKLEQKKEDLEHIIIGTFVNNGKRQRVLRIRICNLFCVRYAICLCTILYMYSIIYIYMIHIYYHKLYLHLLVHMRHHSMQGNCSEKGCVADRLPCYSVDFLLRWNSPESRLCNENDTKTLIFSRRALGL